MYRAAVAEGTLSIKELAEIRFDADSCGYCGQQLDDGFTHVDHVVPLSKGGRTVPRNLIAVCSRCNCSKGARDLDEWLQEQPVFMRDITVRTLAAL